LSRLSLAIRNGTSATQTDDSENTVPVTRIESISAGRIDDEKVGHVQWAPSLESFRLREGDILLSHINSLPMVGNCALFNSARPLYSGMNLLRIQPTPTVYAPWLWRVISSDGVRKEISARAKPAINQASVTTTQIKALQLPVPPVSEQRAIADFLDRETARLDTLVGKKRELIEKLKEKRTALISRTVTRGLNPNVKLKPSGIEWLGDIPEHWKVKKLSWLFRYCKGPNAATLTKEYVASNTGDFPVFSGQTENEGLMGMVDDHEFDFRGPVIFVTTVGARAMTTRLVSGKFSLSQNCALIVPRATDLSVAYYNGVLRRLFDFERRSISLIMQPSLRFEDLHKFRVPRPPSLEQRAIAVYLDAENAKLDRMMEKVEAAIETLLEYRTALITAAVTGRIDVRKAADSAGSTPAEAASTLPV
jgi:type I restriction enzyme S subunit